MNILATTDFSTNSLNALNWIVEYLSHGGGNLDILSCVSFPQADIFVSAEDYLVEKGVRDMEILAETLKKYDNVNINTKLYKASPKEFILKYSEQIGYDLIVTGAKGLTNLKDITVGSLTEYLAHRSTIPILTIPIDINFKELKNIVVGMSTDEMSNPKNLLPLIKFLKPFETKIHFVQVKGPKTKFSKIDYRIERYLSQFNYDYVTIDFDKSVSNSLHTYADTNNIEMITIIHKRRNMMERIFHKSQMKKELFNLAYPLMIIPD